MSRSLNTSRTAVDVNRKPSKMLKCKRSASGTGRKSLSNMEIVARLMGGADISEPAEETSSVSEDKVSELVTTVESRGESVASQAAKPATTGGPCCTCIAQVPGSVGDKKMDEMIDFVQENLQEAGKALATLGENFEHDSKKEIEEEPVIQDSKAEVIAEQRSVEPPPPPPPMQTVEIVCTDAAIQSIMKDKDRMRRELELEAEITRLKRENQRIIRERAEYENAIQRALLRGVSCLNVEALRVLRSPPIPCCTPCSPCPPGNVEATVCKRVASNGMSRGCVTQRSVSGKCVREPMTAKRPCGSPCCSAGRNRKTASSNSMIFLLHQGDAENLCVTDTPPPRVCGQPVMKKIEIPPCPRF
nr:uncharacterized protein LOC117229638 isoform X2 [Megalopta genalis]